MPWNELLRRFPTQTLGSRKSIRHPWWWPRGRGTRLEDWGLTEAGVTDAGLDPRLVLRSLQFGDRSVKVVDEQRDRVFDGFPGSLGPAGGRVRVWILSIRPSLNRFRQPGSRRLAELMQGLSWQGQPLFDVARVVDLFPFRGASDASKAWRSAIADSDIVEASAGLLDDLLRLDSPELVLVPGGSAQKALNSEQLAGKLRNVTRLRQVRQPCYFWAAQGMTKDRISASWRLAIGRADRR